MLKTLRSFDKLTRQVFYSGSDSDRKPRYSCLSSHFGPYTIPEASYDWIFRGSGAAMPPLVGCKQQEPSYLMGSAPCPTEDAAKTKLKCVLLGDGAVGKTSLIVSYTTNGYPTEYVPTAFDNYNVMVTVDNQPLRLQLCDTAGQDDFDSLRPLCYPGTDVFLVCFSVVSPTSFHNVREKWMPELRLHQPTAPVVLVGTQCDLRNDVKVLIELAQYREQPVTEIAARKLAQQIGASAYIESSALTQRNLKEVFDTAIVTALEMRNPKPKKNSEEMDEAQPSLNGGGRRCSLDYAEDSCRRKRGWKKFCCLT